jgi:pyridoxal phosphate enzyme (YggS family)
MLHAPRQLVRSKPREKAALSTDAAPALAQAGTKAGQRFHDTDLQADVPTDKRALVMAPVVESEIARNLADIQAAIARAAEGAGRGEAPKLVAVSKGQPAEKIRAAFACGQRDFGENYVQELAAKRAELVDLDGLVFHAIGPLQRNKVKECLRAARVVHTVDRAELAIEIDKRATERVDVLAQVNVGREPQKSGVAPEDIEALVDVIAGLPKLRLVGLMTVPPLEHDAEQNRPLFAELRGLRDRLVARGHRGLVELSMGMSHDFEAAIAEGATMVRIGTAIFGARAARG